MIQGYYYSKPIPASEFENDFSQLLQKAHSSSLLNKNILKNKEPNGLEYSHLVPYLCYFNIFVNVPIFSIVT
jgi:hypothetical protein